MVFAVAPMAAGAIVSGISSILGSKSKKKAAEQAAAREYERQKEFAQFGIRWKVDDAKAAGLHPLAAIGGSGASYTPTIAAGDTSSPWDAVPGAVNDLVSMGQNTTRAQVATMTDGEKALEEAALRRAQLQNTSLEWDILSKAAAFMGQPRQPSMPSAVSAVPSSGAVLVKPSEVTSHAPGYGSTTAGVRPSMDTYDFGGGLRLPILSGELAEAIEGMGAMGHVMAPGLWATAVARDWWHGPSINPEARYGIVPGGQWMWDPVRGSFHAQRPPAPTGNRRDAFAPGRGSGAYRR